MKTRNREKGLVSVIIPCYNHGEFVNGAIECIRNQTYQNFEIIVVDDGSNDNTTRKILQDIDYPDVQVFFKENGDVASARNYGIVRSIGQYILTLDSDDRFHPTFVGKAVVVLNQNPEVGMVTSYISRIYSDRNVKVKKTGGDISTFVKEHESSASLLFRYQCWQEAGGYDEDIHGFEDWEFAINVTKRGWTVHSIPEYLFIYRNIDEESMYNRVLPKRPEIINYMIHKHKETFKEFAGQVIYDREKEIKELKESVDQLKNSVTFKIGSLMLAPNRWFKSLKKSANTNSDNLKLTKHKVILNDWFYPDQKAG